MIDVEVRLSLASFELDVSLSLEGRVTAILGPSGAGKTSLLETIAGLRKAAQGRILVDETVFLDTADRAYLPPEERHVGYVPQEPALFPHLSVRENVRYGARNRNPHAFDRVVSLLEIGDLLHRAPSTLSGGEAQRVALGRALVTEPRLLLLDEPLAALDAELKQRILPYLIRIRDEHKVPMLYVTHHPGEALALADEAVLLRKGRLVAKGAARSVLTPKLLGNANVGPKIDNVVCGSIANVAASAGTASLEIEPARRDALEGGLVLTVPASADLAPGMRVVYRVTSDAILVTRREPRDVSARNALRARVANVDVLGGDALVAVEASGLALYVTVTAAALADLEIRAGSEVWLAIKTHAFERIGG